uniref:Transcription repressor n=1 Tax=Chenopodium quinoa TaxID=63459 RepID=A0A803N751_CHEQI
MFKPKDWRPICTQQPKTSSFRITTLKDDHIYKTINSVYFDNEADTIETPDSWFTNSSEAGSLSTAECDDTSVGEREIHLEAIVRGAQQSSSVDHRLFFDRGESDSPRLQNTVTEEKMSSRTAEKRPFKKSVAMSLESEDPYVDFRKSMEEMVESLGVRDDWEGLEELLRWYLKINGREIHGYIINAFVDLLAEVKIIDDDVKNDPMIY